MAQESLTLRISRAHPEPDHRPSWVEHRVPVFPQMSVLDALLWVRRHRDPTVAFRYACRVGMCGSCGVVINGSEGLACRTLISTVGPQVRLEPMRTLPVLKDLVVEMEPFFRRYRSVMPNFVPADDYQELAAIPPATKLRGLIDEQRECISCGLCLSACSVVAMDESFLGPAALNRAYCLVTDPREGLREERLDLVARESGLWRCHTLFSCAQVCPKGISPAQAIQHLKRRVILRSVRSLLWPWGKVARRAPGEP